MDNKFSQENLKKVKHFCTIRTFPKNLYVVVILYFVISFFFPSLKCVGNKGGKEKKRIYILTISFEIIFTKYSAKIDLNSKSMQMNVGVM